MNAKDLLEAIRVVKENERIALESYAAAAKQISVSIGQVLFEQLSEFEKYHYEVLTALEKSLMEKGEYISYEGKEFPLPPIFEIKAAQEPNQKSIIKIVAEAKALETEAEKAYADLADKITDPQGHKMFLRLAEEEHNHFRILSEAYWTISNLGVWKWSRP